MSAFLQDAQRDRGGGQRERQARNQRAAPAEQAGRDGKSGDRRGGEQKLRDAEPENIAPHREQPRQFQFEPDQEQQHGRCEFGDRKNGLGPVEYPKSERPDHNAGHQIATMAESRANARSAR